MLPKMYEHKHKCDTPKFIAKLTVVYCFHLMFSETPVNPGAAMLILQENIYMGSHKELIIDYMTACCD